MLRGPIGSPDPYLNVWRWWKNFEPSITDGHMNLNQDFQEFVELFVAHEVDFRFSDARKNRVYATVGKD